MVRSTSCRPATSASAASSASWSSVAVQPRWRPGCCRSARSSSSWLRNHIRYCANDSGTRSGRVAAAATRARAVPAPAATRGRDPGRGRRGEQRPDVDLGVQHRADPGDQLHGQQRIPAQVEEAVVGPDPVHAAAPRRTASTRSPPPPCPAPGPPPLELRRGQRGAVQLAVGRHRQLIQHHHRGRHHVVRQPARRELTHPRRVHAPGPRPAPRTRPAAGARAGPRARSTAAWATPGCAASTASISPGSTRNPRIFTWSSARPANTSSPPAVHRARSPVRYIRSPRPERAGHEPLRGQPRPAQVAARQPAPRPHTARRPPPPAPGSSHGSSTNTRVLATGRADRHHAAPPRGGPAHPVTSHRPWSRSARTALMQPRRPRAATARPAPAGSASPRHHPASAATARQALLDQHRAASTARKSRADRVTLRSAPPATPDPAARPAGPPPAQPPDSQRPPQLPHRRVETQRRECSTRTPGPSWYRACIHASRFTTPRCATTTPLGVPVDPDV